TRWEGLTRFLDDGRIELDSNTVERSIRPIALNRKNALFAGSDDGGEHWAVIASLIETAKLNGIDPQAWLTDTLSKLAAGHRNDRLGELMPWNYSADVASEQRLRTVRFKRPSMFRRGPAAVWNEIKKLKQDGLCTHNRLAARRRTFSQWMD